MLDLKESKNKDHNLNERRFEEEIRIRARDENLIDQRLALEEMQAKIALDTLKLEMLK